MRLQGNNLDKALSTGLGTWQMPNPMPLCYYYWPTMLVINSHCCLSPGIVWMLVVGKMAKEIQDSLEGFLTLRSWELFYSMGGMPIFRVPSSQANTQNVYVEFSFCLWPLFFTKAHSGELILLLKADYFNMKLLNIRIRLKIMKHANYRQIPVSVAKT